MILIYTFLVQCYTFLIRLASIRNPKAKLWIDGRKNIFRSIQEKVKPGEKRIWVHCASLGEFEQGRPLIEEIRNQYPDYKIFLTFFSPSGYEIRKNYEGADYIFYLPADTRRNSKRLIRLVQPRIAIFVKYEFWFNYLRVLKDETIPVLMVSAIFRENQYFFRWYGAWAKGMLKTITHFFVQNNQSVELLKTAGFENVTLTGDTRFDRVKKIASAAKPDPLVESFAGDHKVFLAGSSWPKDEELIIEYMRTRPEKVKFIIAAHEVEESHISAIENMLSGFETVRYSALDQERCKTAEVLIIDGIGYLSRLYRYATIAYIGGGFGKGIHNILEAVTFGKAVIFGTNYHKFQEAVDLVEKEVAYSITDAPELKSIADKLLSDPDLIETISQKGKQYIETNSGASAKIISFLSTRL